MTASDLPALDRAFVDSYRTDERRLLDISERTARLGARVAELARQLDLDRQPWGFDSALVELGARHGRR